MSEEISVTEGTISAQTLQDANVKVSAIKPDVPYAKRKEEICAYVRIVIKEFITSLGENTNNFLSNNKILPV